MLEICGHSGQQAHGVSLFPTDWRPGGKCTYWVSTFFWHLLSVSITLLARLECSFGNFPKSPITTLSNCSNGLQELSDTFPFFIMYFGLQEAKPSPCPLLLTEQGGSIHWTSFIDNQTCKMILHIIDTIDILYIIMLREEI